MSVTAELLGRNLLTSREPRAAEAPPAPSTEPPELCGMSCGSVLPAWTTSATKWVAMGCQHWRTPKSLRSPHYTPAECSSP